MQVSLPQCECQRILGRRNQVKALQLLAPRWCNRRVVQQRCKHACLRMVHRSCTPWHAAHCQDWALLYVPLQALCLGSVRQGRVLRRHKPWLASMPRRTSNMHEKR